MKFNRKSPFVDHLTVGTFNLRFSEEKVEIETTDKHWKQVLYAPSKPYAEITSLRAWDKQDAIFTLCYALYSTVLFFYYPDMCIQWIQISNDKAKEMQAFAQKMASMPEVKGGNVMDMNDVIAEDGNK